MTDKDQPRRFTDEEMAEINRYLETAPPTPVPDGPLPPLESDDPEWVAARWAEFARGEGPRRGRRARWNARRLRDATTGHALLEVLCKGRLIAVVYPGDDGLTVITEVTGLKSGAWTSTWFALVRQPVIAVACRCGQEHMLRSALLAQHARDRTPGKPLVVGVSAVEAAT